MKNQLANQNQMFIHQKHEIAEILTGFETRNRYVVYDSVGTEIGSVLEEGQGFSAFLKRIFLKSHRPLNAKVFDSEKQVSLILSRPFFFFLSDLYVTDSQNRRVGRLHRRFAIFSKKYDLYNEKNHIFARVQAPFWRIWKFPLIDHTGGEVGEITKKWRKGSTGILTELFTDADTFLVDFGQKSWSESERAVIFATAISIDFDFFENNHKRN